jgi:hypothetical protein
VSRVIYTKQGRRLYASWRYLEAVTMQLQRGGPQTVNELMEVLHQNTHPSTMMVINALRQGLVPYERLRICRRERPLRSGEYRPVYEFSPKGDAAWTKQSEAEKTARYRRKNAGVLAAREIARKRGTPAGPFDGLFPSEAR